MYMKKRGRKKAAASMASGDSGAPQSPPAASELRAAKPSIIDVEDFDHRLGDYQLMEGIGKGGYGVVYRGLNVTTGQTVAVKRLALTGIPEAELDGIMMEIKLLEALAHPNIVKYLDSIQTADHLCIFLEYVENGALSSLLARFGGQFPESLVCHYIAQVLMGLHYLHTQGVIHRDIKGANILSTKEGDIKLADFGVATRLTDSRKSDSVVGTPYWMAPEIIEMTGQQSSACDIWSVGCTTLELITGKPPYFDLQQMPALFRIVQDDHPPLPDGISASLRDFLLECFQKDPNRRIDAAGLLRHPWLKKSVEKERAKGEGRGRGLSGAVEEKQAADKGKEAEPGAAGVKQEEMKKNEEELKAPPLANSKQPAEAEEKEEEEDDDDDWGDDDDDDSKQQQQPPLSLKPRQALGEGELDDIFAEFSDDDEHPVAPPSSAPLPSSSSLPLPPSAIVDPSVTSMMIADSSAAVAHWKEFVEDEKAEEDEFADMEDAVTQLSAAPAPAAAAAEDDDVDPFDDIEFNDSSTAAAVGSTAVVSEEDQQLTAAFMRIIALLTPDTEATVLIDQCERLISLYHKSPHLIITLMNQFACIPIMESLTSQHAQVILSLLRLINLIITANQSFLQSLCCMGLIPTISGFLKSPVAMLRYEAANFIRQFCYTSDYTRKMFIACHGLSMLIEFMSSYPYEPSSPFLILNAIDCIRHIFDIATQPKNDFCRLFAKYGLLPPLVHVMCELTADLSCSSRHEYLLKISQILHMFSQGDTVVRQQFAQPVIIQPLLFLLHQPTLPPDVLLLCLKSLASLSMDCQTLDALEDSAVIQSLVPFMQPSSPIENQHQALLCLYYLCQLKTSRQETAACCGLIPELQRVISSEHPMKQLAYPVYFQLCKASRRSRGEMKKHRGVHFLLDCLDDPYWRSHAMEMLALWLTEEPQRVGFVLCQSRGLSQLYSTLQQTANRNQLEKLLPSLRRLLLANVRVNQMLGRMHHFVALLIQRLLSNGSHNGIRVNILNILSLLLVAHTDALGLASEHELADVLTQLAADRDSVLVASLAQKMLDRLTAEAEREEELAQVAQGRKGKR